MLSSQPAMFDRGMGQGWPKRLINDSLVYTCWQHPNVCMETHPVDFRHWEITIHQTPPLDSCFVLQGAATTEGAAGEEPVAADLDKARALGDALLICMALPWFLCFVFYSGAAHLKLSSFSSPQSTSWSQSLSSLLQMHPTKEARYCRCSCEYVNLDCKALPGLFILRPERRKVSSTAACLLSQEASSQISSYSSNALQTWHGDRITSSDLDLFWPSPRYYTICHNPSSALRVDAALLTGNVNNW